LYDETGCVDYKSHVLFGRRVFVSFGLVDTVVRFGVTS
jgi:hypothetical protein